jgi:hypothetical protein
VVVGGGGGLTVAVGGGSGLTVAVWGGSGSGLGWQCGVVVAVDWGGSGMAVD